MIGNLGREGGLERFHRFRIERPETWAMIQPVWKECAEQNYRPGRPAGMKPEAIVIHIAGGSVAAADSWFHDAASIVSAHYLVSKTGEVHQYVQEVDTAFHAGIIVAPAWPLLKPGVNPNFYTIGIEHEGHPEDVWPDAQLRTSATLLVEVATRWRIPLDPFHVIGHHMIRATKACPGSFITPQKLLAAAPAETYRAASAAQIGETAVAVRVRREATTDSPILRVLPAGLRINIDSTIQGQAVSGNRNWLAISPEGYVWAGAVKPVT